MAALYYSDAANEGRPNPLSDLELATVDPAPTSPEVLDGHLAHEFRFESNGTGDSRNACIYAASNMCQLSGVIGAHFDTGRVEIQPVRREPRSISIRRVQDYGRGDDRQRLGTSCQRYV